MSQALCFNEVQFDVILQNSQPWVRGSQIATALQYASVQRIIELYTRHADEFTPAMTTVVTLPTEGGPQETRIFSLRGCHLLAMFARTPIAKAFRKWVLDVLDRIAAEERAALPHVPHIRITPSTPASRKPLEKLVKVWARQGGLIHAQCWTMLNAAFNLQSISDLPEEWIPDAITWVQGKIDGLPKALPAPNPVSTPLLSLTPEELAALDKAAQRVEELNRHVMKEISDLHGDILDCLDLRRMPFPAWRFLGAYIYSSLRRAAVLPSNCLEREENPALAMKMLAGVLDER